MEALNSRFCLVYSGQRKLGRTVLREVMGGYLRSDPVFKDTLGIIHSLAGEMCKNIEEGNIEGFVENINTQTELTSKPDTGYINESIESILESCKDMTAGKMICGAGGGGFLQIILKQGYTKRDLDNQLKSCFPGKRIEVWNCDFINDNAVFR